MGDWTNKEEFIADLEYFYVDAWDKRASAQHHWDLADYNFTLNPDGYATYIRQILDSLQYLIQGVDYLTCSNWDYEPPFAVAYGFKNWTGGVDMDAILNAMWDGDLLRWFHFINYIDSMRAGIWNIEIYDTHLADWYRHFST